jgi:alkaline phosphatase
MVPVFSKGVGSKEFSGIYDNTEIFYKMMLQIK